MDKKVALVTGASSGIGLETALTLQKKGYIVYAAARRLERMGSLKQLGIHTISLDVTDDDSLQKGINHILKEEGSLHVLINSAGYGSYGAIEDVPLAEARRQIDVNLFGLARLIQLVLPQMRKQQYGKIVNISSIGGKMATPLGGWYHASKFAVEGLSDALRNEVKQFGIDVIVIEPGVIKTNWISTAMAHMKKSSQNTAYAQLAEKVSATFTKQWEQATVPAAIAEVIFKAVTEQHPKARYHAGFMSGQILFAKRFFSDSLFDTVVMREIK